MSVWHFIRVDAHAGRYTLHMQAHTHYLIGQARLFCAAGKLRNIDLSILHYDIL